MTKQALILGAGMIGSAMAFDLEQDPGWTVTLADLRQQSLERAAQRFKGRTLQADLSDPKVVAGLVRDFDVVLGALPSVFGLQTLKVLLESGRPYVDISFMPENAWELDDLAKQHKAVAVVDCGVAPGVSNLMCGYGDAQCQSLDNVEIYVGGLPLERHWPFEYKAGFAPHDVIEEYTRPARLVEHGRVVVREALSEPELMTFPGIGTLEAFNTDGLRSLAYTLKAPFMKEKTLRYPSHIELMRTLREIGFFSKEPIALGGQMVRPLDLTAALMFPQWTFEEGEADLTVMRVIVDGRKGGRRTRYAWDLLDRCDPVTGLRSMSRTTAFPATSVARLLAAGGFSRPGVHPPEVLGREPGLLEGVLSDLRARGVAVTARVEDLGPDE